MGDEPLVSIGRSVLCVLPDRDIERPVTLALSDYRLTAVSNGLDALRALNATPFDAYALSYWLPDWAGLSLCREIRKSDPHVPICMAVGESELHEKRAVRAGADGCFSGHDAGERLAAKLVVLMERAEARCAQARAAQERVLREEIRRRAAGGLGAAGEWPQASLESLERTARIRACEAYITAGGTLASFQREWRSAFDAAASEEHVAMPRSDRNGTDGMLAR